MIQKIAAFSSAANYHYFWLCCLSGLFAVTSLFRVQICPTIRAAFLCHFPSILSRLYNVYIGDSFLAYKNNPNNPKPRPEKPDSKYKQAKQNNDF